ncbi:MAG: hypothetical protein LBI49_08790, partial [Nocardiopsaceae bacterium]|nr:hypothetical protein [Nocardiopsaceae bacterium]
MTIGGSIALIVLGAILKYAVNWQPKIVSLPLIGNIMMIGGAAGLIISLIFLATRHQRSASSAIYDDQRRYPEPPAYDDQRRYREPPAYDDQRRYREPPAYDDQRRYPEPPAYDDQRRYREPPAYDDQRRYR